MAGLVTCLTAQANAAPMFATDNQRLVDYSAGGNLSLASAFATGLTGVPYGVCNRPNGQILVSQFSAGNIIDVSGGGDFSTATPFATNIGQALTFICSETQVLVADYSSGRILDVSAGGDASSVVPFATGLSFPIGMQAIGGRLYVAQAQKGVTDITDGGDMSAVDAFAMPADAQVLYDVEQLGGRMLAGGYTSVISGAIWDISGGGTDADVFAQFPSYVVALANVDGTLWVRAGGSIYNATAGGVFAAEDAFATGVASGYGGLSKEPFSLNCGNNVVDEDEACDEGGVATATCNADCTAVSCGDGTVNTLAGEQCDTTGESSTCNDDCTLAECGDGLLNVMAGEECDDAGESTTCNTDCTLAACGDGIINTTAGETCDASGESVTCDVDCTASSCGDGLVNATDGEDCDDAGESAACNIDCTSHECGDGIVNATAGEDCDDAGESATCNVNCTLPACGDGIINASAGETCDDAGESVNCDVDCSAVVCGDGVVNISAGEGCDDGNLDNDDACLSTCVSATCGDGVLQFGVELCDDGAQNSDSVVDACRTNCTFANCGDGIVDTGEACDDGTDNANGIADACRTNCQAPRCGDGVVDTGESCDLGDGNNSDVASNTCRLNCALPSCGDGVVDTGESCDLGNANSDEPGASCRTNCATASCGDGIVDPEEECDEGDDNAQTSDTCRTTCVNPACGDGVVDTGEACDDGQANANTADTCRPGCIAPRCGDGIVDSNEGCDDGNLVETDSCLNTCVSATCGDGVTDANEECDDGTQGSNTCTTDCKAIAPDAGGGGQSDAGGSSQVDTGNDSDAGIVPPVMSGAPTSEPEVPEAEVLDAGVPEAEMPDAGAPDAALASMNTIATTTTPSTTLQPGVTDAGHDETTKPTRPRPRPRTDAVPVSSIRGGGCSVSHTGKHANGAWWALLGGFGALWFVKRGVRRLGAREREARRRDGSRCTRVLARASVAASGVLLCLPKAHAQQAGFALNRFDPSERGSEWFWGESLDLRGKGRVAAGLVADWAYKPLVGDNGSGITSIVRNQLYGHLGAAVTFADRVRFGLNVPVLFFQNGTPVVFNDTVFEANEGANLGDIRLGVDVGLVGKYGDPAVLAIGAHFLVPTGSREAYTGDEHFRFTPRIALAGDIDKFVYSVRTGIQVHTLRQDYAGMPYGTDWQFGATAGARLLNQRLVIGPELWGSTVISDSGDGIFESNATPLEGLIGAHFTHGEWRFGAGVGTALSSALGSPQTRVVGSIEWVQSVDTRPPAAPPPDLDGDGVLDVVDACPTVMGAPSADMSTNGCPPQADTDADGILDDQDACPSVAGPTNTDPAKHGCPKADADGDEVLDDDDACKTLAGEPNAQPERNGCPPDKDADGVFDSDDACVDVPGVKSEDNAKNGCPADQDGDGIIDTLDACPTDAGPENTDKSKHGCPLVQVTAERVVIHDRIEFDNASATIRGSSAQLLEQIAEVLRTNPQIKLVRIEGHTDSRGAVNTNVQLSQWRANAVRKRLVKLGIDQARLTTKGIGPKAPIASNETEEGRQQNRRVEFHIVEKSEGSAAGVASTPQTD